jgi:hypothetical protein
MSNINDTGIKEGRCQIEYIFHKKVHVSNCCSVPLIFNINEALYYRITRKCVIDNSDIMFIISNRY